MDRKVWSELVQFSQAPLCLFQLPGGSARNHSGNPALRRPSLKCSPSSGRLQMFAKIPWLIVNQCSMRSASAI